MYAWCFTGKKEKVEKVIVMWQGNNEKKQDIYRIEGVGSCIVTSNRSKYQVDLPCCLGYAVSRTPLQPFIHALCSHNLKPRLGEFSCQQLT